MKRLPALLLLALLSATTTEARKPLCTLRVHLEANANDSAVFSTQLRSPSTGKKIVMEKVPRLSEQDVLAFYPYESGNGNYGALLKLTDHGKLALDTLSVERRGAFVYIFLNGRPVAEQQIDRRVSDGRLYLASGLTQNDLALMAKEWRVIGQREKRARR